MAAVDSEAQTVTFARPALAEMRAEVDALTPGAVFGGLVTGILYAVFFVIAKTCRVLWRAWGWCFIAGRRGWRAGMGQPETVPSTAELLRLLDAKDKQLQRYESGFVAPGQPVK